MPTVIDVIVVGLSAIVTDVELDCRVMASGPVPAQELHVLALDPGWPDQHEPYLGVRLDALASVPASCFKEDLTTPADRCGEAKDVKWARYDLRGRELRIDQPADASASVFTGERKIRSGFCWDGAEPVTAACKLGSTACNRDASWIPEIAKVAESAEIARSFVEDPEDHPVVSAVARSLRGQLEASGSTGPLIKWQANHSGCTDEVPSYEQRFNTRATIENVTSTDSKLHLLDLQGFGVETIDLVAGMTDAQIKIVSYSPHTHWRKVDSTKCPIPHYEIHKLLVDKGTSCWRTPYFEVGATEECDAGFSGPNDPVCPPVVIKVEGGGRP